MTGYDFHPEAETDLDEIWEYIAADNVDAADRIIAGVHQSLEGLVPFPNRGHRRPDLTARNAPCPCGSAKKYKRCCGVNAPPILFAA